jgi:hypothetical protein
MVLLLGVPAWGHGDTGPVQASGSPAKESVATENYPKLHDNLTSRFYRGILKAIPYTRTRAFHGNYGGSGNAGGPPIDAMDDLFRRHDILYNETRTLRRMVSADRALCVALGKVDADSLDKEGRVFRDRAIAFFESPASRVFGKTPLCWIRTHERAGSPFPTDHEIYSFLGVAPEEAEMRKPKGSEERLGKVRSARGVHARVLGRHSRR